MNSERDTESILIINLSRRLPDVHHLEDLSPDLERYGRCAVLRNGTFWYGETMSSHPPVTKEGFYWAFAGSTLYFSPRGAAIHWEQYITDDFIRFVAEKAGLKGRFRHFRLR